MNSEQNQEIRKENKGNHISESFHLAAILAIIGGYMDAYTYLARGKVFANAQTGNIVLLGIKIMDGKFIETSKYLVAIVAFVIGIFVAEMIHAKHSTYKRITWQQIILLIEILALFITAFLPIGSMDIAANTIISFVSALQMGSFRYVNGNAFVSTMCTGNLRSGTVCLYQYIFKKNQDMKNKWIHYYGIILFFIAGAALGAWITHQISGYAIMGCCLLLSIVNWQIREKKL
jgi:Predicted membrane protein